MENVKYFFTILSSQIISVSTVSGATFSSNSIIEAVADALDIKFTNPNSSMSGGHGKSIEKVSYPDF